MVMVSLLRLSVRKARAFTLVELLAVIGIILILVAIGVPNFINVLKRARITQARTQLISYKAAISQYHTDTRSFPQSGSEHFYYIIAGIQPFNQRISKQYDPPYYDFTTSELGRPGTGEPYPYGAETQILRRQTPTSQEQPISLNEVRIPAYADVPFYPVIDPWRRPVIYISPVDLKKKWNEEPTPWAGLIAVSDETRFNDHGIPKEVPYDMEIGQFWSAGPDGVTAANETDFGFFQPGNLSGTDGRDNDGDGLTDASDSRGKDGNLPEDDVNSWN